MNVRITLLAAAMLAIAGIAEAQHCSGGAGGGMDATGNECSDVRNAWVAPAAPDAGRNAASPQADAKQARPATARAKRPAMATASQRVARSSAVAP
jgi:hypothetical protein